MMKMAKMELTKKSKETLYNRYNGYGVVFLKTSDREMTIIEISLGRNGKFYTMSGALLTERLNELSVVIKED